MRCSIALALVLVSLSGSSDLGLASLSHRGLKVSGVHAEIDPLKEGNNPLLQQKMKPRHLQMIAVSLSLPRSVVGANRAMTLMVNVDLAHLL